MSVAPEPVHDLYMSSQAVTAKGIQGRLINPALIEHARQRRLSFENRLADRITSFSGSMQFVYLHAIWFTVWIASGVERYPYGLLTMIVSLEAIFLSTFVMISQNRADEKREVIANQEWQTVQVEDKQNQELLDLSHQILELTKAVHAIAAGHPKDAAESQETDDGVTTATTQRDHGRREDAGAGD